MERTARHREEAKRNREKVKEVWREIDEHS